MSSAGKENKAGGGYVKFYRVTPGYSLKGMDALYD